MSTTIISWEILTLDVYLHYCRSHKKTGYTCNICAQFMYKIKIMLLKIQLVMIKNFVVLIFVVAGISMKTMKQ